MGAIRDFLGALALVKFPNNNVKKITAADLREYQDAVAQKIEENIPYVDSSQIGAVTTTANSLTVALHPSGENYAIIGGVKYAKLSADPPYSFTPVSPGKLKSLIYYAKPDSTVFYLAEGVEGLQAVDPDYDGLLIKKIIITDSGAIIEPDLTQYQLKANQAWVNLVTNDNGGIAQTISIHHGALRFNIISSDSNIKFGGFRFYASQFLYDGVEITIRNGTAGTLEVVSIIEIGVITINPDGTPIKLKSFETLTLAYHLVDGFFYALKSGGGGASFPEIGSNGDILEKDSTVEEGAKWVTKIKGTTDKMLQYWNETAGNFASSGIEYISAGIVKMKVIAFGGYTILQRNAIASPTEGMLIYQNESPKGFQKYENGAWSAIGSNISNADLSNVSARIFTQGNTFTWNTAGFSYFLKNLLDKTGDSTFNKKLVVNSQGEVVMKSDIYYSASSLNVGANSGIVPITLQRNHQLRVNSGPNNTLTITLAAPVINELNEYILVLESVTNHTQLNYPSGIKWRGRSPMFTDLSTKTFIFEQCYINGVWRVYGSAIVHEL